MDTTSGLYQFMQEHFQGVIDALYEKIAQLQSMSDAQAYQIEEMTNKLVMAGMIIALLITLIIILIIILCIRSHKKKKKAAKGMSKRQLKKHDEELEKEFYNKGYSQAIRDARSQGFQQPQQPQYDPYAQPQQPAEPQYFDPHEFEEPYDPNYNNEFGHYDPESKGVKHRASRTTQYIDMPNGGEYRKDDDWF